MWTVRTQPEIEMKTKYKKETTHNIFYKGRRWGNAPLLKTAMDLELLGGFTYSTVTRMVKA